MLKADLHLHTCDGIVENFIDYNAFKLIDTAMGMGFDVLSITNHDAITYNDYLKDYARERGILLIPGVEITMRGKHILAYNIRKQFSSIKTIADIKRIKDMNNLFIAPHPYFPAAHSLGRKFMEWQHLFDAVELSHFYTEDVDFNKQAVLKAKELNIPLIGTSDSHVLRQFNTTYTMIDAEKNTEAVFDAIRKGAVEIVTSPLSLSDIGMIMYELVIGHSVRKIGTACFYFFSLLLKSI